MQLYDITRKLINASIFAYNFIWLGFASSKRLNVRYEGKKYFSEKQDRRNGNNKKTGHSVVNSEDFVDSVWKRRTE